MLHVNTSVGRGTAGTDFNAIPSAAIERIEVLRDGAAAQYGSDAIAGVINIVLKDDVNTGDADIYWGQTYEGDGDTWNGNANYGMKVGESGFFSISPLNGVTDTVRTAPDSQPSVNMTGWM